MPRSSQARRRIESAQCIDQVVANETRQQQQKAAVEEVYRRKSIDFKSHENQASGAILLLGLDLLKMMGHRACRALSCINSEFCLWDAWKTLLFSFDWQQSHSREIQSMYQQQFLNQQSLHFSTSMQPNGQTDALDTAKNAFGEWMEGARINWHALLLEWQVRYGYLVLR